MLNDLMKEDTAGDPMSKKKWCRKDTRELSEQMSQRGITISPNTVGKVLKDNDYSLRVNRKSIGETNNPHRDAQFRQIADFKKRFEDRGLPIVSSDSKKKELIGEFKNNGTAWRQDERCVFEHDFRSHAKALASPYGLYDYRANRGMIVIGTSADTSEFAVDAIEVWLKDSAFKLYPTMRQFLVLCDSGGSNGYRTRLWKARLYQRIATRYGLKITVCHYPPGASKWNPVEHRLFSFVSMEWQAEPLVSLEFMKNKIEATKTKTGLTVSAKIMNRTYQTGVKVSNKEFSEINIKYHDIFPMWNYTIMPY